jgi:hypothetical protein
MQQFKHQAQKKQYCSNCCQQKKKELNQNAYQNKKRKLSVIQPDADQDRRASNSNSLRNGNITVEAVPFKEECRIIDSDKAELIVFDVSSEIKNSESLSDWNVLEHTYGDYEGDVFEYKPYKASEMTRSG